MAKRTATRELNHDNWDDEEEEEEAGSFQQASDEALKGRVIKQAKRRITGNDGEVIYFVSQEFLNNVFHKMSQIAADHVRSFPYIYQMGLLPSFSEWHNCNQLHFRTCLMCFIKFPYRQRKGFLGLPVLDFAQVLNQLMHSPTLPSKYQPQRQSRKKMEIRNQPLIMKLARKSMLPTSKL
jgi:hypothetical protein